MMYAAFAESHRHLSMTAPHPTQQKWGNDMSEKSSSSSSGIGFVGLLTIVFITLKLTNYIDWSWWWVLSPIWISWAILLLIIFPIIIVVAIKS